MEGDPVRFPDTCFKKLIRPLFSLPGGIVLLVLTAAYSIFGTLVPGMYSSAVLVALLILLALNLAGCTVQMLPSRLKQCGKNYFPAAVSAAAMKPAAMEEPVKCCGTGGETYHTNAGRTAEEAEKLLKKEGFSLERNGDGITGAKYRWGALGASITHLGILIILAGGALSALTAREGMVRLVPGQGVSFESKGFTLLLEDFSIDHRDDGTVEQYTSRVLIEKKDGETRPGSIRVNYPLSHGGLTFYQTTYGWLSNLVLSDVRTGQILAEAVLENRQVFRYEEMNLDVHLYGYFPEYAQAHDGTPLTLSERDLNPRYVAIIAVQGAPPELHVVHQDEKFVYGSMEAAFTGSIVYTGILYRKDPWHLFVFFGAFVMAGGVFISFYLYPRFVLFKDGSMITFSRKNGWGFFRLMEKLAKLEHEK